MSASQNATPGVQLCFYVHENQRIRQQLAWEWLLERARHLGIHGGSAFRAIAGYGRHGVMHEDRFFELAGDLPVMVSFVVSAEHADALLALLEHEAAPIVYVRSNVEYGSIGAARQPGDSAIG